MKSNPVFIPRTLAILVLTGILVASCAPNWPQFRGPDQSNIAIGKNLPLHWNDSTNIRWSVELEGESWTSPVVLVDKIFTAAAVPVKVAEPAERQEASLKMKKTELTWKASGDGKFPAMT